MKKFILVITIILGLFTLASCKFAEENEYDLQNPTRVAVMTLDVLDILNEVGIENTSIKKLGMLFKGNVKYLDKFNNDKEVYDLGTHNAINFTELDKLDPELIILGSRVSSKEEELSKMYPNALIYNAAHGISNGDLAATLEKNIEFLGKVFPEIKVDLSLEFNTLKNAILEIKNKNELKPRALVVLLNGDKFTVYQENSRFGMIYKEFGFEIAKHSAEAPEGEPEHGAIVTYEAILEVNPDVIFILDRAATIGEDGSGLNFDKFVGNELIQKTIAATSKNIFSLDGDAWYMTSGGFYSSNVMIQDMNKYFNK